MPKCLVYLLVIYHYYTLIMIHPMYRSLPTVGLYHEGRGGEGEYDGEAIARDAGIRGEEVVGVFQIDLRFSTVLENGGQMAQSC